MKQRIIWTKEWLKKFGFTDISADGKTIGIDYYLIQQAKKAVNPSGYEILICNGLTFRIHRLVYCWFHGEIKEGQVIDHIDGNRHNNALSNLQALTYRSNLIKAGYDPIHNLIVKVNKDQIGREIYERKHKLDNSLDTYTLNSLHWASELWNKAVYRVNVPDGPYYLVFNKDELGYYVDRDVNTLTIKSDDFHLESIPKEELPIWLKK